MITFFLILSVLIAVNIILLTVSVNGSFFSKRKNLSLEKRGLKKNYA
ncbi:MULTISPECIES: hypothetical protein [Cellulophaga]|nr:MULTISPECIES: hypothetical protein [Cellulophaga]MDO6854341.1 hypothetical protein [Cellulophaga lytica]WBU89547.1 hypothetical protein PBN93_00655 [Cellulophaga omnivescoria]WKB81570.1 hypothetical protein QYR09_00655 [Cellulophaga lytica]WQG77839.1 hypothetical protein SR888_02710 [Cellulophaga lytica]SNQ43883.1 exported hypothetical protein [Cellulophaga lytica]